MAELKNLTVKALRDLARKAIGRGHSRLKTKDELIAALQAAGKNVSGAAGKAAARVKAATGRAAKAASQVVASTRASAKRKAGAKKQESEERRTRRAKAAKPRNGARPKAPAVEPRREEPDADGYFVARVRGEEAARDAPHPMTEGALDEARAEPARKGLRRDHHVEEDLGELPWTYDDDVFVVLPRDPKTLYVYWDHREETLRRAFQGVDGGRAQLWVLARTADGGWERVRTLDFALESRSYFVHDLEPGRTYRAEMHVVDRGGRGRPVHGTSNVMQLPPFGPSPIVDDRFMRLPWGEPLTKLLRHVREGAPFPEELRALLAHLSDWSRFLGPTWGPGGSGAGAAGGPGGRPSGPSSPSSPSSPFGPFGWHGSGSGEGR